MKTIFLLFLLMICGRSAGQNVPTKFLDARKKWIVRWDAATNAINYRVAYVIGPGQPTTNNTRFIEHTQLTSSGSINGIGHNHKVQSVWIQSMNGPFVSDWTNAFNYVLLERRVNR